MKLAVLVNLRARRGSERVAEVVHRLFPRARLALTRSLEEMRTWIAQHLHHDPPALLLAGGGDGTITGLLNELKDQGMALPPLGVLPLGTGNAWARVTGAPPAAEALAQLAQLGERPVPLRTFGLVEVEGRVAPFAGTGWDAEMVKDFKDRLEGFPAGAVREAHAGLRGYLAAMLTRTVPRHLMGEGSPNVSVYNLGGEALTVDPSGSLRAVPHGGEGALLYRGSAGVAGAATTPEWGFGFRAYPFAEAVPGRMSVRVYSASVLEATRNAVRLWRGAHPLPHMHDFLVQGVRMEFDRDVPLQLAGDLAGMRRTVELRLHPEQVQLVDWRRVARLVA